MAIRFRVNKAFQTTAAHTLPSPIRNISCGILRVMPKPKKGDTCFIRIAIRLLE